MDSYAEVDAACDYSSSQDDCLLRAPFHLSASFSAARSHDAASSSSSSSAARPTAASSSSAARPVSGIGSERRLLPAPFNVSHLGDPPHNGSGSPLRASHASSFPVRPSGAASGIGSLVLCHERSEGKSTEAGSEAPKPKRIRASTKGPRGVHISSSESPTEAQGDLRFGEGGEPPRRDQEDEARQEDPQAVPRGGTATEIPPAVDELPMNMWDAIEMLSMFVEPNRRRFAGADILEIMKMKGFEFPHPWWHRPGTP